MFLVGGAGGQATTLDPSYEVTVSNSAASANAHVTTTYSLESPDTLEAVHLSFIPSSFGVAADGDILNGAKVGSLSVTGSESISNSACSNSSFLGFDLLDATTNTTSTVGDNPRIPSPSWPGIADTVSANGLPPANGLPDAVDLYPNFLNNLYPGLTPRARAFGWLNASIGTVTRVVNVLVFNPGTALPGLAPLNPSLGYIVVVVEQDPTAPASPSVLTDRCSSFAVIRQDRGTTLDNPSTTSVNEGGAVYRTNPGDGSYTFMDYGRSLRDLDDDGIENQLDTCPSVVTTPFDPRVLDPVNDPDNDGVPGQDDPAPGEQLSPGTGCDPQPSTSNSDIDGDAFVNREDNCPLVANGSSGDNQADTDKDGLGNTCDAVDTAADGHVHEVCVTKAVSIGAGGTPSTPACPQMITDEDNDGFTEANELTIGTDPIVPCGFDGWPADLYPTDASANKVDVLDITTYIVPVRRLNSSPGPGNFDARWDVSPGPAVPGGYWIDVQDLTVIVLFAPPMLEGPRAFQGPPCPYP